MAEKKINGRVYRADRVLATEAVRLQARLLRIIGGAVDRLPDIMAGMGSKKDEAAQQKSNAALAAALADMFAKADPDEVTQLISDIVGYASLQAPSKVWEQVDLDGVFTQHPEDLYPVVAFVITTVLGSFFSALPGIGSLPKAVKD